MLEKLNLQKLPVSFIVALIVHGIIFFIIGKSFTSSNEIAFGEVSSNKNVITFDLGSFNVGKNVGAGKALPSTKSNSHSFNKKTSNAENLSTSHSSASEIGNTSSSISSGDNNATGSAEGIGNASGSGSEGLFVGAIAKYQEPNYPAIAIKRNLQGTVIVKINILKNGEVSSYEIIQASGHAILDNSVLEAVKNWKFKAHPEGLNYFVKKTVVFVLR